MSASPERVAEVFVEAADTLVAGFDLVDFLYRITERMTDLSSMSATGLLLADPNGHLQFMAASDERTHLLELFQIEADQGPCRDCYRSGRPVVVPALDEPTARRWPRFVPRALEAGFGSAHAFPLRLRNEVIGVVGLFGETPQDLDSAQTRILQSVADVATIAILQERAIHRGQILTEQLQGALNDRIVIEQAKGVLAQIHSITVDQAFAKLRGYVNQHDLRLVETANAVINHPNAVADLTTRQP